MPGKEHQKELIAGTIEECCLRSHLYSPMFITRISITGNGTTQNGLDLPPSIKNVNPSKTSTDQSDLNTSSIDIPIRAISKYENIIRKSLTLYAH